MRTVFFVGLICVITWSCKQKIEYKNQLVINPDIKKEVITHVKGLSGSEGDSQSYRYSNNVMFDYFVEDTLKLSFQKEGYNTLFTSFYRKKNQDILISAEYDLFGGIGHAIKLADDKIEVYYLVSATREAPSYALNLSDDLVRQLYVPCSNFNLVLSQKPKESQEDSIYGMLEFETDDFFKKDRRTNKLHKEKNIVKIYFKSNFLPS